MRRALTGLVVLLFAACGFAIVLRAAATPPPLADMEETSAPGLNLTLESNGAKDLRTARLVALRVPAGAAPSPFLAPGNFKATWEGTLTQRIKGDYNFLALGRGTLKVTINDEVALEVAGDDFAGKPGATVKLKKGKNTLRAEYTSPKEGDATVRLLWSAKEFIPESLPPMVLTHDGSDKPLREQERLRAGRMLVAEMRCLKCHSSDAQSAGGAMREFGADTPSLADVGQRYTQAWLAHWINDPHAMRVDTTMPRVFVASGDAIDQRARDIAAYLVESSAKRQAAADQQDAPQLVAKGARLYTALGCVGCHTLADQEPAPGRVSHKFVRAKFQPGALKEFLLKPETHYQWIKMPNFRLSDEEATALSAFVRSRKARDLSGDISGDAKRGKELFQSAGCLSCHSSKLENSFKAPPLSELGRSDWSRGCVAKDAVQRGKAPDFHLTDEQRDALLALGATDLASLKRDTAGEFAERQIVALNCVACHARDRQDDAWSQLFAEVEAITKDLPPEEEKGESEISGDQSRPPLTWVGEKLRPAWMATFIAGELKYKPRTWLAARMPGFPARAKALADGLAEAHGCPPSQPPPGKSDPQLAEIGRKLVSKNGGFSCIQCHSIGEQRALAPFEAPAINFAHVTDRLTREYYDRWVYNPQRVLPGTRMPQFSDSEGKTALKDTLGGDAKKQYDAIWNYLLSGPDITPP